MTSFNNQPSIETDEKIFEKILFEKKSVGYYDLPFQDISTIESFPKTIHHAHIAVIGIGGSSLGAFAIYDFLLSSCAFEKSLHFFESTDPTDIASKTSALNLQKTFFIVVSKSGTTLETVSILKYIASVIRLDKSNCAIISEEKSVLSDFGRKNKMQCFCIPENVGGRFSVFSAAGLVPLALVGVDIKSLLLGAQESYESFFSQGETYKYIMNKARFIAENRHRYPIHVLFSYSSALAGFNKWFVQLWGESLGKVDCFGNKQPFTPVGLIGPVDQHSFLQLIMEGHHDKLVTFVKISNFNNDTPIPSNTLLGYEALDYLDGYTFAEIINMQADSIVEAISSTIDTPVDVITVEKHDAFSIGKLMFTYQLLTSVTGQFVGVDTYNQPGVELGKQILKIKLQKESNT